MNFPLRSSRGNEAHNFRLPAKAGFTKDRLRSQPSNSSPSPLGEGRGEGNFPSNCEDAIKAVRTSTHLILLITTILLLPTLSTFAISKSASPDEIPPLRPPRGEIPATYWEQHGSRILLGTIAVLAVASLVLWRLSVVRPTPAPEAGVVARKSLDSLAGQPEDGALLSKVSQVVRRYFQSAFALPAGEMTTTEFNRVLTANPEIEPELSTTLADFLRRCDERKFSLPAPAPPLGAVAQAQALINQGETLRRQPVNSPPPTTPASAQPQPS